MDGWIKLHRKCLFSGLLQNAGVWQLFTYCLLKASHKPHKQMVGKKFVELKPGQLIFGRKKVAAVLDTTEQKVRTNLNALIKAEILTSKTTNHFTLISIVNWDKYQVLDVGDQPATQPTLNQGLTNGQPTVNHKQECKNEKNEKKTTYRGKKFSPMSMCPDFASESDWRDLIAHRKKAGAVETERAYKVLINEFRKSINEDGFAFTDLVDLMSSRGWKGFKAEWAQDKIIPVGDMEGKRQW